MKPGDKVKCLKDHKKNEFTKGQIYEVESVCPYSIFVIEDNFGGRNGWGREYFRLIEKPHNCPSCTCDKEE